MWSRCDMELVYYCVMISSKRQHGSRLSYRRNSPLYALDESKAAVQTRTSTPELHWYGKKPRGGAQCAPMCAHACLHTQWGASSAQLSNGRKVGFVAVWGFLKSERSSLLPFWGKLESRFSGEPVSLGIHLFPSMSQSDR